ncbi:MAG: MBOAT family O-acyltransferase [Thermosynechococcaceae cyanobacterium]
MIFTEFRFIIFFLVVALTYWKLNSNKFRKLWLLAASYTFYGAWDWRFLGLILFSTIVDYIVSLMVAKQDIPAYQRKVWLAVSLISNLGLLGFFKYFNFFADSAQVFFSFLGLPVGFNTLHIILPVGISFYTFQTMSYTIDVYLRKLEPVRSPLDLALYVSFFPQLVAGPIVRASDFLPQLKQSRVVANVNIKACLALFLVGFFKKACISDNLAPFIDAYFSAPETYTAASAWIGVVSYAVQIYCDFSGYSDMAIASAGLLGYEFCLNFNFPYFSRNIAEFWRNWHISLSTWLRDYLYIPLGGNRVPKLLIYRNLMITMLLGGLWHGAGWNFIIWGGMHGIALVLQREFIKSKIPSTHNSMSLGPILGSLGTFYFVCITWIFFRASDFDHALIILKSFVLFDSPGAQQMSGMLAYILLFLGIAHWFNYRKLFSGLWERLSSPAVSVIYGLCIPIMLALMSTSYNAFIYFQF